jgi:hypothetical protein
MSNKTRLQTNNTNLQALIDKANSLPDAGSSGGGSVETCTVTLIGEAPIIGAEKFWYTDETLNIRYVSLPDFNETTTLTVVKNSIVFIYSSGSTRVVGNITELNNGTDKACFVSGDASIATT